MKFPVPNIIQKALDEVEDVLDGVSDSADDMSHALEDAAAAFRDSFKASVIQKAIKMCLVTLKSYPVYPDDLFFVLPPGIKITFSQIHDRIDRLIEYANEPPATQSEFIEFIFTFGPTELEINETVEFSALFASISALSFGGGAKFKSDKIKEVLHHIMDHADVSK